MGFSHEKEERQQTDSFVLRNNGCCQHDALITKIRRSRNHHSLIFQTLAARTDIYISSFFRQTIRNLNALPDSIYTTAKGAEEGVARFTTLVRDRD